MARPQQRQRQKRKKRKKKAKALEKEAICKLKMEWSRRREGQREKYGGGGERGQPTLDDYAAGLVVSGRVWGQGAWQRGSMKLIICH